jgi:hypothetical protein
MQLKAYNHFINELDITSLKHLFQNGYNKDPQLKKDIKKAEAIFSEDTFSGTFKHNKDEGFYVSYEGGAPKMDRVKQLMSKVNADMEKLELEIDKSASENPSFFDEDDRLVKVMFFMVGKIKEK